MESTNNFVFLWYFILYFNGILLCVFAALYFVFLRYFTLYFCGKQYFNVRFQN